MLHTAYQQNIIISCVYQEGRTILLMDEKITTSRLANGLTVRLKEIHNAPIVSHWVWYRVGSRDEEPGKMGISHWVEHMQFKGTPKFPSGVLDKAISRSGGYWNAFTFMDWTAYFQTMPADQIDLALDLEADRMVNSLFEADEVDSERTVIISELEGNENEPMFRLGRAVQTAAFSHHPYQNEVIGSLEDLRAISRDDLYNHYRTHYTPGNAVVAVAGDFDSADMMQKITGFYGSIQPADVPAAVPLQDPLPAEEKRVVVEGPGETAFIEAAYRAPSASHKDFFALSVLDSLLTGPSGLNMFGGGGISNRTSRMYQSLVETEHVVNIYGSLQATIDPFVYSIISTVHPAKTPELALCKMDDEIKRIQDEMVTEDEVQRAVKQARALFAYGSENITNQAFWLGYADMFDRYEWFLNYINNLDSVTPAQVQKAAQEYLDPSRRVVGFYKPLKQGGRA